ncbi:MAG: flagellar protein FlaG [Alphaproteobacteria bacterium]
MDVSFASQPPLPPQSGVGNSQSSTNNTTGGEVRTLQHNPASVVTSTANTGGSIGDRHRDTHGRHPDERVSAQKTLESLRLTSRRTQIDFNPELNRVFLQIVDTRTDEVVESIPPEELVRQLKEQVEPRRLDLPSESSGTVIDEQV